MENKLAKNSIIRLFDNQEEITKLNVFPLTLLEEMVKTQVKSQIYTGNISFLGTN